MLVVHQVLIQVRATAHRATAPAAIQVHPARYHLRTAAAVPQMPRGQVRIRHRRIVRPARRFRVRATAVRVIHRPATAARQVQFLHRTVRRLIRHRVIVPARTAQAVAQFPVRIRVLHTARRPIQVQAIQAAVRLFLRAIAVRPIAVLLTAQALIHRPVVRYPAATAHRHIHRRAVLIRR